MRGPDTWSRNTKRRVLFYGGLVALLGLGVGFCMVMPGDARPSERATTEDEAARAERLTRDLAHLAGTIGERNVRVKPAALAAAGRWLTDELSAYGYIVEHQRWSEENVPVENLWVDLPGTGSSLDQVVIGAHYDSAEGAPGADDNGTGVVALLALARELAGERASPKPRARARTVRFVFFTNEEPPWFWSEAMGSLHYARAAKARGDAVRAMLSLETLGYFSEEKSSQKYPGIVSAFYPDRGDFLGFVGSTSARSLVRQTVGSFRRCGSLPSEGAALPEQLPGVGWSDHWAFEQVGYPAVMVTDTAPFRYPHYHTAKDTPDKVDPLRLSRAVTCLREVVTDLAGAAD
jgi:hypothetical protein